MNAESLKIQRIYVLLTSLTTLGNSFIWGVNTLFLLDAGLSVAQAFAANAFFTFGQVVFEVPTGVVADSKGRRTSFLMGSATLMVTTLMYYYLWVINGEFWMWAVVSALLGLGFTFFSGAVEAWLVDSLNYTNYKGKLDDVFGKGMAASGAAMLIGALAGGVVAQFTSLGVPYLIRVGLLGLTFVVAMFTMKDLGFTPVKEKNVVRQSNLILKASIRHGLMKKKIKWLMFMSVISTGVGFYAFYVMQPYLLELYGDPEAYAVAGIAAALISGSQIIGGFFVRVVSRIFNKRTSVIKAEVVVSSVTLVLIGVIVNLWVVLMMMTVWSIFSAATRPVRQSLMNSNIASKQRATVLSFDSLFGSAGGAVIQPALGKTADIWSYGASLAISGVISLIGLPLAYRASNANPDNDKF